MNKTVGWIVVIVAFLVIAGGAYLATRHSQKADATATANVTGVGVAYDATTGNTVPANATPGALGSGVAPTVVSPVIATPKGS